MYQFNAEQINQIVAILNGLPISELKRVELIVDVLKEGFQEEQSQEAEVVQENE